jgi:glycosyltransferase involved in cell wall biosynthesis
MGRFLREFVEMQDKMSKAINSLKIKFEGSVDLKQLSIVIPTFNEEKQIKYTVKVLTHNFPAAEVIVVDAMSADRTTNIAEKHGARILRAKLDIGNATNLGILEANGQFVIRTDADTLIPTSVIASTVAAFRNPNVKVFTVGHLYYDGSFLANIMAHLYDKYIRTPQKTTGWFIAVRKASYTNLISFRIDDDFGFGLRAYNVLGSSAFLYKQEVCVLTSARAIKKYGVLRWVIRRPPYETRARKIQNVSLV